MILSLFKTNTKNYFFILSLFFNLNLVRSQDPHFSQFYSSPLTLNPANTGLFSGDIRFSSNYRNQWRAVSVPFTTSTISADFQILSKKISDRDIFGVGFIGMVDQSNNRGLKSNFIGGSASYTKSLDINGFTKLSVGFQGVLTSKKVDYNRFVFSRQFTPFGFDNTLPTGEPINGFSINYPDFSTGILYTGMSNDESNWYLGTSYYHFTRPSENFSSQYDQKLQPRFTIHSGYNFLLNDLDRLYFSGLFMHSMLMREITIGGVLELYIDRSSVDSKLLTGMFHRINDALIPYIGFNTGNFQVGVSYDINTSSIKTATKSRGGFELSLLMTVIKDPEKARIPKCTNRF